MQEYEFKPFEKVLVKENNGCWCADFFSHYETDNNNIKWVMLVSGLYCSTDIVIIPYNGNEHLLGTADDPTSPEPEFKFGDKVEVRNSENEDWIKGIFFSNGHLHNYPFSVILERDNFLVDWKYCRHTDW